MTPEPTKPKECPFCKTELVRDSADRGWWHNLEVPDCFLADTITFHSEVEAWNRRASPWRPISDAPKVTPVLVYTIDLGVRRAIQANDGTWWCCDDMQLLPSLWMPLPEPPKEPAHLQIPQESAFHNGMIKGKE